MPKKIDPAVRARVMRMIAEHRSEYATPTGGADSSFRCRIPRTRGSALYIPNGIRTRAAALKARNAALFDASQDLSLSAETSSD